MKTFLLVATVVIFATTANLSPVSAATFFAPTPAGSATGIPHHEWQYHYGKKAHFEGHWVLVR